MSTSENHSANLQDAACVKHDARIPWFLWPFLRRFCLGFAAAVVGRAHERGLIDSRAYHELVALAKRAFVREAVTPYPAPSAGAVRAALAAEFPRVAENLRRSMERPSAAAIGGYLGKGAQEEARKFQAENPLPPLPGKEYSRSGTDPSPEDMKRWEFEAIWQIVKGWDIERRRGDGYAGGNGTDVVSILRALDAARPETTGRNFLKDQAKAWMDTQLISPENIGAIRAGLLMPFETSWNSWVREETAARELLYVECEQPLRGKLIPDGKGAYTFQPADEAGVISPEAGK